MKKKYNIEITRSQINVLIRALDELQYSIMIDNNNTLPRYEISTYYIAKRWEKKLMELKNE